MGLPNKVLRIHEITFALPDDFSGTASDAFDAFIEYRKKHMNHATIVDPQNELSAIEVLSSSDNIRVCGDIVLYELSPKGTYEVIDGSFINETRLNELRNNTKEPEASE